MKKTEKKQRGEIAPTPDFKLEPETPTFDQSKDPAQSFFDGERGEQWDSPLLAEEAQNVKIESNDFSKFEKFYEATLEKLNKEGKPYSPDPDFQEFQKVAAKYNFFNGIIDKNKTLKKAGEPPIEQDFFAKFIFSQIRFIDLHKYSPIDLINHFVMFEIDSEPLFYFFLDEIVQYLLDRESERNSSTKDAKIMNVIMMLEERFGLNRSTRFQNSIAFFSKYLKRIKDIDAPPQYLTYIDLKGSGNYGDIELVRIILTRIQHPDQKIKYLQNSIRYFNQCAPDSFDVRHSKKNLVPFEDLCQVEIDYINGNQEILKAFELEGQLEGTDNKQRILKNKSKGRVTTKKILPHDKKMIVIDLHNKLKQENPDRLTTNWFVVQIWETLIDNRSYGFAMGTTRIREIIIENNG